MNCWSNVTPAQAYMTWLAMCSTGTLLQRHENEQETLATKPTSYSEREREVWKGEERR